MFELEQKAPSKEEDAFHFVAYLPIKGRLYELDGLKNAPIDLGAIPEGSIINWNFPTNTNLINIFNIRCWMDKCGTACIREANAKVTFFNLAKKTKKLK